MCMSIFLLFFCTMTCHCCLMASFCLCLYLSSLLLTCLAWISALPRLCDMPFATTHCERATGTLGGSASARVCGTTAAGWFGTCGMPPACAKACCCVTQRLLAPHGVRDALPRAATHPTTATTKRRALLLPRYLAVRALYRTLAKQDAPVHLAVGATTFEPQTLFASLSAT